jgi:hypothetical protein
LESLGTETKTVYVTATAPNGYAQKVKVTVKKVPSTLTWDVPNDILFFTGKTYKLPDAEVNKGATINKIVYTVYTKDGNVASDMKVNVVWDGVEIVAPTGIASTYPYREYKVVAKCDNYEKTKKITVVSTSYLSNYVELTEYDTNIFGTYKTKLNIFSSRYLKDYKYNDCILGSICFSPDKQGYYILEGNDYKPNEEYSKLEYYFDDLDKSEKETDMIKVMMRLYDYNRNNYQSYRIDINLTYSFLGYEYRYSNKRGNIKAGETITVNYINEGYLKYFAPGVNIYQIYYSDNNKTKDYLSSGSVGGETYTSSAERTMQIKIRDYESPIYVKYKK